MMTPSLMVVASIVVVAIAVENVSEKSILPCPIFHRPNVTTGLLYRVFTDNVFACKRTKKNRIVSNVKLEYSKCVIRSNK